MEGFTKADLLKFLDMVISKGWVNTNTGNSWRAAVRKILGSLPDDADIRDVDLNVELLRYNNLNPGDLAPDSLRVYEQRAAVGIQQFLMFKNDPQSYKAPGRGLSGSKSDKGERVGLPKRQKAPQAAPLATPPKPELAQPDHSHHQLARSIATDTNLALPFPLRPNYLAQVVIPRDMTKEEADRLCVFIQALAQSK